MSETELTYIVIFSILFGVISLIRSTYWRAKYETLKAEHGTDGWAEEARFWRHHFNNDAADAANDRY